MAHFANTNPHHLLTLGSPVILNIWILLLSYQYLELRFFSHPIQLWNTKGDKIMLGNPGIRSTQFLNLNSSSTQILILNSRSTQFLILNSRSLKLCLSFLALQTPYLVSRTANSVPRFSHGKLRTSFLALQTPYLVSRTANSVPRFSHCKLPHPPPQTIYT